MKLHSSEEAMNFKSCTLASSLKIELTDGNRRETIFSTKTKAADATISPRRDFLNDLDLQSLEFERTPMEVIPLIVW